MKIDSNEQERIPVWEREDSISIQYGKLTLCIPNVRLKNPAQRALLTQDFINHVLNTPLYESMRDFEKQTWNVYSMHSFWPFFKVEDNMYDVEKKAGVLFINQLHAIADNWSIAAAERNLTHQEVAHGVVHSILRASEGGNAHLPGFEIRSIDGNYTSLENNFYDNLPNREEWPTQVEARAPATSSLHQEYAALYDQNKAEHIKEGLARSAADLFT